MIPVRNEDIELLIELNEKLHDERIEKTLARWLEGREKNRETTRKVIAKRREENKNYARKKN